MIVCVCQGVSHHEVGETIAGGATTVEAVTRRCGAGRDCGTCHDEIRRLLDRGASPTIDVAA